MKSIATIKYVCEYCNKAYDTEAEAVSHEENSCVWKSGKKNCIDCAHKVHEVNSIICDNSEFKNFSKTITDLSSTFDCTFWVEND